MNRLAWVGHAIERGKFAQSEGLPWYEEVKWTLRNWRNAVCFDFGDNEATLSFKPISDAKRLPFDTTWAEMRFRQEDNTPHRFGILCREEQSDIAGLLGQHPFRFQIWNVSTSAVVLYDAGFADNLDVIRAHMLDFNTRMICGALSRALTVMACANVKTVETKPSMTERAMAMKRAVPAFSVWTLHIRQTRTQAERRGGSHASPRVHLRRGHIRHCASGCLTWVQPCVVGDPSNGAVWKDYVLDGSSAD